MVHRADLHLALLEACRSSGKVEMRTRHAVSGYRQDENTVFVQVENRDEIEGTALIGRMDFVQRYEGRCWMMILQGFQDIPPTAR